MPDFHPVTAVVVGLCAHGLALVRELHAADIPVIALESDPTLPGLHTRLAQVIQVRDINGSGLIDALNRLASQAPADCRLVLILTNDRMVQVLGERHAALNPRYHLSWAHAAERLLPLLDKGEIEARCQATGLNYPRSAVAPTLAAMPAAISRLKFPVIIKPLRPLSAFKTLIAHTPADLQGHEEKISTSLPVLVQEYIAGDDSQIHFAALCLDHGNILARFEGRKLHSRPLGHTTIGISAPNEEVHQLATRFFAGLALSGPVSLELKRAPDGRYWVIEPTVGRTDFWSGLCAANGVPLAATEFLSITRHNASPAIPSQAVSHNWLNTERFPAALPWLLRHHPQLLCRQTRYTYLDPGDQAPFWHALSGNLGTLPRRALGKLARISKLGGLHQLLPTLLLF